MTVNPINSGVLYLLSKLFINNPVTIKLFTSLDPLTYASGGGYQDAVILGPDTVSSQGSKSTVYWPTQVFTFTSSLDNNSSILGYHLYYDDNILGECIFDNPITPVGNGGRLSVKVSYVLNNAS